MQQKMKHGKETVKWAKYLLGEGVAYSEIERETGIPVSTLRVMKTRLKDAKNAVSGDVTKNVTSTVSENVTALQSEQNVTEQPEAVTKDATTFVTFCKNFITLFHPIDGLFYLSAFVGCNGIASALHSVTPVNYLVASVLFGVAFIALQGLKTLRGWQRLTHILMMAFAETAFFCSDVFWAHNALWKNVSSLPLDIRIVEFWSADAGRMKTVWMGQTAWPFYIACGVAVILFSCAVYACAIALQKQK